MAEAKTSLESSETDFVFETPTVLTYGIKRLCGGSASQQSRNYYIVWLSNSSLVTSDILTRSKASNVAHGLLWVWMWTRGFNPTTVIMIYITVPHVLQHDSEEWGLKCITRPVLSLNLLEPTGHVMHQQFNIQQLYALPTLYLCDLYLSENKQRLVPLTA